MIATRSEIIKKYVNVIKENTNMISSIALNSIVVDVLEVLKNSAQISFAQLIVIIAHAMELSVITIWDLQRFLHLQEVSHFLQSLSSDELTPTLIHALRILFKATATKFNSRNDHLFLSGLSKKNTSSELQFQFYQLFFDALQLPLQYRSALLSSKGILHHLFSDISQPLPSTSVDIHFEQGPLLQICFKPNQTHLVSIDGLRISTIRTEEFWRSPRLVHTSSAISNLRNLAQCVTLNIPIILQGESGSGKSFFIRELAALMGVEDSILELHLDEQTDNKSLIGSYICSDVPGEFLWQPGLITQAVTKGHWLVIEDIDKAPLDVIATITPILETGKIMSGIQGEILVHPNFRMFGTCTNDSNQRSGAFPYVAALRNFNSSWHTINLNSPSLEEIELILSQSEVYCQIQPSILEYLLSTYKFINIESTRRLFSRMLTLRDLLKSANRMSSNHRLLRSGLSGKDSNYVTEQQRIESLCEVVDVFLASVRKKDDTYYQYVKNIAVGWNLSEDVVLSEILNRNPTLTIQGDLIRIGRIELTRAVASDIAIDSGFVNSFSQSFAFSKASLRLLEAVAGCVSQNEPILLVGETGCGKTTVVQELANLMCHKLVVQNMSLSTDSSDLLGGFRPVSLKQLFQPTYEQFVLLFRSTFSQTQNSDYLQAVSQYYHKEQWKKLLKSFEKASINALAKLSAAPSTDTTASLTSRWNDHQIVIKRLECNLTKILNGFAFAFVDGLIVEAMKKGYWVLLDEINLASSETLQGLIGILDGQSLCLTEKGDVLPVQRHSNFRIFAAMNPPTDVGKRELPSSLRTRFTEIYVPEMLDRHDLHDVVDRYLQVNENSEAIKEPSTTSAISVGPITDAVDVYLGCRASADHSLTDGAGQKPHYSLRSLTRALKACNAFLELGFRPLYRALYEGFTLSFQTQLDDKSRKFMETFLAQSLRLKDTKSLHLPPSRPGGRKSSAKDWVLVKPYWIRAGPLSPTDWSVPDANGIVKFVMTPTVENNIRDLARAIGANVTSVLLQGPTSVGKTTMIEYLAARCGYRCIRINNHEHTDIQEYIGGYVTGPNGNLYFRDGVLVEALRRGDWIILDELNLAPSDVLEALNRLLDDNRELYVPETGEFIKPAPGFFLFATQNPAGLYGGRKPLSRAFRNRFIEIFIGDIPYPEVETIVSSTCGIPSKYSKLLVSIMKEMHLRRQQSTLLQGKSGSITTRDLIKWGRRIPQSPLDVIRDGYMILAERHRSDAEKEEILQILLRICKVDNFPIEDLYSIDLCLTASELDNLKKRQKTSTLSTTVEGISLQESAASLKKIQRMLRDKKVRVEGVSGLALTQSMKRLWTLVHRCAKYSEPALIIGETGCGKTTVCQLLAAVNNQQIRIVNCHQSTETADIIGGLRPVRGRNLLLKKLLQDIEEISSQSSFTSSLPCCNRLPKGVATAEDISVENDLIVSALQELSSCFSSKIDCEPKESMKRSLDIDPQLHHPGSLDTFTPLASKVKECEDLWLRYQSLFEWQDGPLVEAMKNGDVFVLDEINLAEDAVIERLNSVLESSRTITLAEKGGDDVFIVAHPNFRFYATMNPGDDYGKRELSPALRSRFSEIWVSGVNSDDDIILIITEMLPNLESNAGLQPGRIATLMVEYMNWINMESKANTLVGIKVSVREVLAWAKFIMNWNCSTELDVYSAFVHGVQMLMLDGLGIGLPISRSQVLKLKIAGLAKALSLCPEDCRSAIEKTVINPDSTLDSPDVVFDNSFCVGAFSIPIGSYGEMQSSPSTKYVVQAKSTRLNFQRVLRAMKLPRPILLEGPPGVGKTSLISNLAKLSGHKLIRINLSEHSEISDLIGSDLPAGNITDGEDSGAKFKWCDGVFLDAMKNGYWVLLDELNLAPQSVLEGLNACFDHRGEVFISELGKTISCPPSFRVFCAQNPMAEGGGRKGLPQSFLTRFSRVYIEPMTTEDMILITTEAYSKSLPSSLTPFIPLLVDFVHIVHDEIVNKMMYGRIGSPWEFNLRDIFRWCDLLSVRCQSFECSIDFSDNIRPIRYMIADTAYALFVARLRTSGDRIHIKDTFSRVFKFSLDINMYPRVDFLANSSKLVVGCEILEYNYDSMRLSSRYHPTSLRTLFLSESDCPIRGPLLKPLEILASCVSHAWPVLLVGDAGSGKRRLVRHLAKLTGNAPLLLEYSATPSTDSTELLGSFEQVNIYRKLNSAMKLLDRVCAQLVFAATACSGADDDTAQLFERVTNIFAVYSPLCKYVGEIIDKNEIVLHSGLPTSVDNVFQDLSDLIQRIQHTLGEIQINRSNFHSLKLNYDNINQLLVDINNILLECYHRTTDVQVSGMFEWVDGIVVEALESGSWLLVNNVNLCSASVLDRLNSLLETNGTLLLTESGNGRLVTPHPNFRVFFTMDVTYGEISRAMRNRCVEVSLSGNEGVPFHGVDEISLHLSRDIASLFIQNTMNACSGQQSWDTLMRLYSHIHQNSQKYLSPYLSFNRLFFRSLQFLQSELYCGASLQEATRRLTVNLFPMIDPVSLMPPTTSVDHRVLFFISSLSTISTYLSPDLYSSLVLYCIVNAFNELDLNQSDNWIVGLFIANQYRLSCLMPDLMSSAYDVHKDLIGDDTKRTALYGLWNSNSGICNCAMLRPWASSLLARAFAFSDSSQDRVVQEIFLSFSRIIGRDESSMLCTFFEKHNDFLRRYLSLVGSNFLIQPDLVNLSGALSHNTQASFAFSSLFQSHLTPKISHTIITLSRWREIFTFSRYWIIVLEKEATTHVESLSYGQISNEQDWSLFEIALMVNNGFSVFNDSTEGKVLENLLKFLGSAGQCFELICSWIVSFINISSMDMSLIDKVRKQFESFTSKRDILSYILLSTRSILRMISWDRILIAWQWMKTDFLEFFSIITEMSSQFISAVMESCNEMKVQLRECENSFCSLWNKNYTIDNCHLWKEGGHSATPIKLSDWEIRKEVLGILDCWIGYHNVPSFVESWCHPLNLLPSNSSRPNESNPQEAFVSFMSLRTNQELMSNWLGILCTFYWSNSNEISHNNQRIKRIVDYQPLVKKLCVLRNDSVDHLNSLMGNNYEVELTPQSDSCAESSSTSYDLLTPISQCSRRIDFELKQNGSFLRFAVTEQDIIRSFFVLSNVLGKINTVLAFQNLGPSVIEILASELLSSTKLFLMCALEHSFFNPLYLREAQTLLWFLESVVTSSGKISLSKNDDVDILRHLCVRFSVMFDIRLYSMITRNLSNSFKCIPFTWESTTLQRFGNNPYFAEENMVEEISSPKYNFELYELQMNGPIRLLQSSSIELILKLLNINSVRFPLSTSKTLFRHGNINESQLTVSSSYEVKLKLSQLFQSVVRNSHQYDMLTPHECISRLHLLVYYTLTLIQALRDYLLPDIYHQFQRILGTYKLGYELQQTLFLEILELDLPCHILNHHVQKLVSQCLIPVLQVLSTENIDQNLGDHFLEIQSSWVCIGMLRFVFSLPASPVDPALRAGHESSLLSTCASWIRNRWRTERIDSSIRGSGAVLLHSDLEAKYVEYEAAISLLNEEAIQRPEDSPLFFELFQDVHDLSENILSIDRIVAMLLDCLEIHNDIRNLSINVSESQRISLINNYLSRLRDYSQNELVWQSTLDTFITRLQTIFQNFEDITSPIISSLQNISFGVRVIVGFTLSYLEECLTSKSSTCLQQLEDSARLLFSVPCTITLSLKSVEHLEEHILKSVQEIPNALQLYSNRTLRRVGEYGDENLSIILSNCLTLAKIDFVLSSHFIPASSLYSSFSDCISYFIASYRGIIEEKVKLELKKSSLYQYRADKSDPEIAKSTNVVFESNDEKEELEAIQLNFPDHLGGFQDILNPKEDLCDVTKIIPEDGLAGDDVMTEDLINSLINVYSRMVLLYMPSELQSRRLQWISLDPQSMISSNDHRHSLRFPSEGNIELASFTRKSFLEHSIVVAKALEPGLSYIPSTNIDSTLRGLGLSILGALTKECGLSVENTGEQWLSQILSQHESTGSPIDRDLLYLLDSNTIGTAWNPYNIHIHPNSSEILLTSPALRKMLQHAVDLLVRFPGNDFLLAICKMTSRISQFSVNEPIGKMLQSLQLLLKCSQEWEQYAAKHVSLADSIKDITALIKRWRTLELQSWSSLLRSREIFYVQRARKFWFTLHCILNNLPESIKENDLCKEVTLVALFKDSVHSLETGRGLVPWLFADYDVAQPMTRDHYNTLTENLRHLKKQKKLTETENSTFDESKYLMDIFESLDGFLRTCVVGEFPTRLHLLRLFCLERFQVFVLDRDSIQTVEGRNLLLWKVASICYGVWCYYSQFLPVVRRFQELLKSPLQNRLNDEIKISKWDDLNIYAVMEHSDKIHRKLTKIIREYETDVLNYPVTAILQREIMSSLISEQGELKASTEIPSSETMFPYTDRPSLTTRKIVPEKVDEYSEGEEESEGNEDNVREQPVAVEVIPLDYIEPEDYSKFIFDNYSTNSTDYSQYSSLMVEMNIQNQRVSQAPKLYRKMRQYAQSLFSLPVNALNECMERFVGKVRYGLMVAEISENMCSDIFYRIETLRTQPSEKSNRSVKHRALADLLQRLKDEGVSHLRSFSPIQSKSTVDIFSVPSILPLEYASHLSHSIFGDKLNLLDKGENYFYRNVCEINQLRAQALSPYSPDISSREVQAMIGQTESIFFHLLRSRSFLSEGLMSLADLLQLCDDVNSLIQKSSGVTPNIKVCNYIFHSGKVLMGTLLEVKELFEIAVACDKCQPDEIWSTQQQHLQLPKWKEESIRALLDGVIRSLNNILKTFRHDSAHPISPSLLHTIDKNSASCHTISTDELALSVQELLSATPDLSLIVSPDLISPFTRQLTDFLSFLSSEDQMSSEAPRSRASEKYIEPLGVIIDDCLITMQKLRSFSNNENILIHKKGYFHEDIAVNATEGSAPVLSLLCCLSFAFKAFSSQRISSLNRNLRSLFCDISNDLCQTESDIQLATLLTAIMPLVECVLTSCVIMIEDMLAAYKSLGKLLYICLRTFRVLLAKGFCSDQTKDGGEGEGDSNDISKMVFEDDVEGTGMGEGEGKKDVSDQIENEEQLLGTKNENQKAEQEKPQKQLNEEEKDTGVEMMQDFEGDMCDLPEEQKNEDESEENEDDEEEDLDREMGGDLDLENIVDEKQWDDEDEDGTDNNEEKFENDSKMKGEALDGEMTTNDEKNEENSNDEQKEAPEEKNRQENDENNEDEGEGQNDESKIRGDDDMEKPMGVDVKDDESRDLNPEDDAPEEDDDGMGGEPTEGDNEHDGDNTEEDELPENMELDGGENGERSDENDSVDVDQQESTEDLKDETESDENEENVGDEDEENLTSVGGNNNLDDVPELPPDNENEPQQLDTNVPDKNQSSSANIGLKSQHGNDSIIDSGEIIEDGDDQSQHDKQEKEQRNSANSSSGNSSSDGVQSKQHEDPDDMNEDSHGSAQSGNESKKGENTEGESHQQEKNNTDRRRMEPPNPFRKLGDINKRWEKRLNMDNSQDDEPEQNLSSSENQKSASYEFEKLNESEDAENDGGTQVLAEANENEAVQLHENSEEQEGQIQQSGNAESDAETDDNEASVDPSTREKKRERSNTTDDDTTKPLEDHQSAKRSKPSDGLEDEENEDMFPESDDHEQVEKKPKDDIKAEDSVSNGLLMNNLENWHKNMPDSSFHHPHSDENEDADDLDEVEYMELEDAVKNISNLDELKLRKGHEQWSQLTAQYQSPCVRLTEQLRLVLEPTLASRLQGDYRTGKRISMRRVIGYVASGFRKDKIWLRRTKPYKREYQIMVMIDDSRSMGEAGPIALAALNVLSGALTRLEVGHIGVCSFAENVSYLHEFHQPFNDTSGSKILSHFQFTASQTRLASALNAILPLFEESKSLSSNHAIIAVQICFIISDARIDSDNREKLTCIIRELAEKHILAVLIVIDKNDDPKDSIFATKSVEFTPTGLVTKSYLDDFPFPYYVAIQQIDALPEVLAGALKQWFELVRNELDGGH